METSLSSPVRVHLLSGELLSLFPEAFAPLHHPMSARQSNSHTDDARAAWKPWPLVEATKTMWPKLPQNTWQPLGWGWNGRENECHHSYILAIRSPWPAKQCILWERALSGCVSPHLWGEGSHEQSLEGVQSPENRSFALAMSQRLLLVFKQDQALGKFRCRPEIHGLAKDFCYCHMSDLWKIILIQKLNVFSWQW